MRRFPSAEEAADSIMRIGRRVYEKGLVAATDGNISVRIGDDRLVVTPSGLCKGFLSRADLVTTTVSGERIAGSRKPTSELKMHLRAYELRSDIVAVVHAHPPYATGFAVSGIPLEECVLPEVVLTIGSVPLARYGTPSTEEVPRSIEMVIRNCDAFLLENHGALAVGADPWDAYYKLEMVEHLAKITFIARMLGGPRALAEEQVEKLYRVRQLADASGAYPGCIPGGRQEQDEQSRLVRIIAEEVAKILKEGRK